MGENEEQKSDAESLVADFVHVAGVGVGSWELELEWVWEAVLQQLQEQWPENRHVSILMQEAGRVILIGRWWVSKW